MRDSHKKVCTLIILLFIAIGIIKIIQVCIILFEPAYPPYKPELFTNLSDYMKVNEYVEELLETKYVNFFPDTIESKESKYYYSYGCDDRELFLTLYLKQKFDSEASFNTELTRLVSFPCSEEKYCDGIEYKIFDMPDLEETQMYLNNTEGHRAWDFTFSAIRIDKGKNEITYLVSYQYDNSKSDTVTVNFLDAYLQDTKKIS